MSLDGLRAWIGEVERKLDVRTRVFLVLTVIAIGVGGAGIYLAIDARESSVSESDVQALQEQLEARIGAGGGNTAGTATAGLEAELRALKAQVEQLGGESSGAQGNGTSGGSSEGTSDEAPPSGASSAKLRKLLEQTKQQNAEAEKEQAQK